MSSRPLAWLCVVLFLFFTGGCASLPLYPQRPSSTYAKPLIDPAPSKLVVHITVTPEGLSQALDEALPRQGGGFFDWHGSRKWSFERDPVHFQFANGKISARTKVVVGVELPVVGMQQVPFEMSISGEPVITSDWRARVQSSQVELKSSDMRVRAADALANVLRLMREQMQTMLEAYSYDLSPKLMEAYQRLAAPIDLPLGEAKGCAALRVTGIEAGPTVLAGGFEKDFAFIVAPSVTMPCSPPALPVAPAPLANVSTLASGPFQVTVPVAASYAELAKATSLTFTNGKLYFSNEYPELYLTSPEIYASGEQIVLKLRIAGPITTPLFRTTLGGDLYFVGHPVVVDNELRVPDLEPTIDTSDFLLKLKAKFDGDSIRNQAREALRLDLGARLAAVRAKISADYPMGLGCLRTDVSKIEVTGIYPHADYLRLYVALTAQAGVYIPCPVAPPATVPAGSKPQSTRQKSNQAASLAKLQITQDSRAWPKP